MAAGQADYVVAVDLGTACLGISIRERNGQDVTVLDSGGQRAHTKFLSDLIFWYDPSTPRDTWFSEERMAFSLVPPRDVDLTVYPACRRFLCYKMYLYTVDPFTGAEDDGWRDPQPPPIVYRGFPEVRSLEGERFPLAWVLEPLFHRVLRLLDDHFSGKGVPGWKGRCEVVVTVPAIASSDAVCYMRELVSRAMEIPEERVSTASEPAAALICVSNDRRAELEAPGTKVAILDIGGGTSDFLYVRVDDLRNRVFTQLIDPLGTPIGGASLELSFYNFFQRLIGIRNGEREVPLEISSAIIQDFRDQKLNIYGADAEFFELSITEAFWDFFTQLAGEDRNMRRKANPTAAWLLTRVRAFCRDAANGGGANSVVLMAGDRRIQHFWELEGQGVGDLDRNSFSLRFSRQFLERKIRNPVIDRITEQVQEFLNQCTTQHERPDLILPVGGFYSFRPLREAIWKVMEEGGYKDGNVLLLRENREPDLAIVKGASFMAQPSVEDRMRNANSGERATANATNITRRLTHTFAFRCRKTRSQLSREERRDAGIRWDGDVALNTLEVIARMGEPQMSTSCFFRDVKVFPARDGDRCVQIRVYKLESKFPVVVPRDSPSFTFYIHLTAAEARMPREKCVFRLWFAYDPCLRLFCAGPGQRDEEAREVFTHRD